MAGKPIIAVTRILPDAGMELLNDATDIELRVWPEELPPDRNALDQLLTGAAGAVTLVTDPIDASLLERHSELKVVANFAVGYDNIDVDAATERNVMVSNTPGVLTETTADFAFALLISAARRIVEGADYVRAGKWQTWGPNLLLGHDVHGATIGIVGYGRIGREVAQRAAGFSMRILAVDPMPISPDDIAEQVDLDTMLRQADFVCINAALTEETRGLIGARELSLMKRSALLINAARGPVVQTDALYEALRDGTIAGAALDVTDPEPLPADHPLIQLPNCLIVPHIASASIATRSKMATMAATNALEGVRGNRPPNLVNESAWTGRS
jgi:glyoxylate reductase